MNWRALVRQAAPDFAALRYAERRALAGASRTLSELRPWWVGEVHAGCGLERFGGSVSDVQAVFGTEGYELLGTTGTDAPRALDQSLTSDLFFLLARP